MRKDWVYKKWADVLTIINGKNQKAVESIDGKYPIYGSGGVMGYANDWLCPENCTIIGRKGNINKPIFVESKFWNVDTAFGLNSNKDLLESKYLYYFCLNYDFNRHNKAVTIPSLTKIDLLKIEMPLPLKPTQQAIVAELDKLNEMIRLKKQQLEDYDQLAQSIFYEMFGDPVENEKGWEVKKLGEISENYDSIRKPITASNREPGNIPYYGASGIVDYVKDFIFNGNYLLISEDGANLEARVTPIAFSISGKNWVNNHAHVLKFPNQETQLYIEYLVNSIDIKKYITGAVQPKLTQAKLNIIPVPLPPLHLQQQFAARIEAIEQQKQQVKDTIKDLETLLASRMQYWFD